MTAPKTLTHLNNLVEYANKQGKRSMPKFRYDGYMEIGQQMAQSKNPSERKEGLLMVALSHHAYGQLEQAMNVLDKYLELDNTHLNAVGAYLYLLRMHGRIQEAITLAENFFRSIPTSSHQTSLNDLLFQQVVSEYLHTIDSSFDTNKFDDPVWKDTFGWLADDEAIQQVHKNMKINQNIIQQANIDVALVQEVIQVSECLLGQFGNFAFSTNMHIHEPNDDLYIDMLVDGLSIDEMNELNEKWLDTMLDHQSSYPFDQVSRVLVNFRPRYKEQDHV